MLVNEKLNGRKDFVLTGFICDVIRPSKKLPVQSYLLKHKKKVWKLLRIMHEDNGVAPVSSLLTVNIFATCCNCWIWTGKCLPGSYWKDKHIWRVYHALCWSILKFINKLHLNLYLHNPTGESVRNFCEGGYFSLWFWLKRSGSYSKWPALHLSFFVKLIAFKLLNYHHFQYAFTQMSGFSLIWITNSH